MTPPAATETRPGDVLSTSDDKRSEVAVPDAQGGRSKRDRLRGFLQAGRTYSAQIAQRIQDSRAASTLNLEDSPEDWDLAIFSSYAKPHHRVKPRPPLLRRNPSAPVDEALELQDIQRYHREFEAYENDTAVYDVEVKGWLFAPNRGPLPSKKRLFLGIAKRFTGIPDQPYDVEVAMQQDGGALEGTVVDKEALENYEGTVPSDLYKTQKDIDDAYAEFMKRMQGIFANSLPNIAVTLIMTDGQDMKHSEIYTDPNGHFHAKAALDFLPTETKLFVSPSPIRLLLPVPFIPTTGVSLVSDIDDTIKHTGILNGMRSALQNILVRRLDELIVPGVSEWYNELAQMGVEMHYVSNSPWQLYPLLQSFFAFAHLPPGSFHLRCYQSLLKMFEPVTERKRLHLERLFQEFPHRLFILVGDSGEADLEIYTEYALRFPGRVLAILIRDVTLQYLTRPGDLNNMSTRSRWGNFYRRSSSSLRRRSSPSLRPRSSSARRRRSSSASSARSASSGRPGSSSSLSEMISKLRLRPSFGDLIDLEESQDNSAIQLPQQQQQQQPPVPQSRELETIVSPTTPETSTPMEESTETPKGKPKPSLQPKPSQKSLYTLKSDASPTAEASPQSLQVLPESQSSQDTPPALPPRTPQSAKSVPPTPRPKPESLRSATSSTSPSSSSAAEVSTPPSSTSDVVKVPRKPPAPPMRKALHDGRPALPPRPPRSSCAMSNAQQRTAPQALVMGDDDDRRVGQSQARTQIPPPPPPPRSRLTPALAEKWVSQDEVMADVAIDPPISNAAQADAMAEAKGQTQPPGYPSAEEAAAAAVAAAAATTPEGEQERLHFPTRREILWLRRWEEAKYKIEEEQNFGTILAMWRTGDDVRELCVDLVKGAVQSGGGSDGSDGRRRSSRDIQPPPVEESLI